jgi:hypothetical protein
MSKKYSRKKKVNGGNIITRRSKLNRHSLSLSRLHSTPKRQLHPKVSTTSKPTISEKAHTKITTENDFMKTYILYTYSNDKTSRENLGINHPLLKDVSVSEYMNSIENIKREMGKKSGTHSVSESNDSLKAETMLLQHPIVNYIYAKKGESAHRRRKRPHSVGGRGPGPAAARGRPVEQDEEDFDPEVYDAPADLESIENLKNKLNSTRLRALMHNTETRINSTWKRRADLFLRHMFIDRAYRIDGNSLLLEPNQPNASNYSFRVRIPHSVDSLTDTVTIKAGPGKIFAIKNGIIMLWDSFTIDEVVPTEEISDHTESTITETVEQFQGKYNKISNVEQRHIIYSTLLFILANSNDNEDFLRIILDQFNRTRHEEQPTITIDHLKFINGKISNKIKNSLPYSLFYTRVGQPDYTSEDVTIQLDNIKLITIPEIKAHIDGALRTTLSHVPVMSRLVTVLPVNSMNVYKDLLDFMYGKIFGNNRITTSFNITVRKSAALPLTSTHSEKLNINKIRHDSRNDLISWFFLSNTDEINCKRITAAPQVNRHIITNDKGTAIFYRDRSTINTLVKKKPYFRSLGAPQQMNLSTEAPLAWRVWYQNTRVRKTRDKLMGYLAELVYSPNDIVRDISTTYLTHNQPGSDKLIYIGPFDSDPSFPRSSTDEVMYSRVHVWMRINTVRRIGVSAIDHELYIVSRGSLTGYDWTSADRDIQEGVLHSFRSSHVVRVLKEIIENINNSIRDRTETGISISSGLETTRTIQLFSVGHSLGGYLSLYLSLACLSNNIMNGISFTHISGTNRVAAGRFKLNSYIIPIAFDPFVASLSLMSAFSSLPYARIHSCIDSSPGINPWHAGHVIPARTNHTYSTSRAIVAIGRNHRYNDVASGLFLDFLRAKYYNVRLATMGRFDIFEYSNSYNFFTSSAIYHDNIVPLLGVRVRGLSNTNLLSRGVTSGNRVAEDMRISHDMCQIVGLSLNYLMNSMVSRFNISTPYDAPCHEQNIQAVRYSFPIPNDVTVSATVSSRALRQNILGGNTVDAYNISYRTVGRNTEKGVVENVTPIPIVNLRATCEHNIRTVVTEFIQSRD